MTQEEHDYWGYLMDSQAMAALMGVADEELSRELSEIYHKYYIWEKPEEYIENIKAIRTALEAPGMRAKVQHLINLLDDLPDQGTWRRPKVRGVFAFDAYENLTTLPSFKP